MKKIYIIDVLFYIIILALLSSSANCVILKYEFKNGITDKYRENNKITFKTSVLGEDISSSIEEELEIKETIINSDKNTAKIKLKTNYIKLIEDGKSLDISDLPEDNFTYTITSQGRILSMIDNKDIPISGFDPKKEVDLFPKEDLKVGDTWDGKWAVKGIETKAIFKLEKLYTKDKIDVAVIGIKINDRINMKDFLENNGLEGYIDVECTGKYYFAVNLGKEIMTEYTASIKSFSEGELFSSSDVSHKYWRTE